ncbi:hypothetical protein [Hahella ganghwensis]|uniref:hypothetical protein n=1 Tax=Hahella ganghwensis TaxID=286420 RepID=UPI000364E6A5|nr:hypothetical protein [Hahella ganghwensis]
MNLKSYIKKAFPEGMTYNDAAQLCLQLYCSLDGVPEPLHPQCTRDTLSETFAQLAQEGNIKGPALESAYYGANFHQVEDKGHWLEVIASIFKVGETRDMDAGAKLIQRLTRL